MLPWKRPKPHPDFEADARVLLDAVRADLGANRPLTFKNREIWSGSWTRRGQARGLHKHKLAEPDLWLAKCAWCEQLRELGREVDVEHYRPKAAVCEWRGTPAPVSDTPPNQHPCGTGYWWLAFCWDNYTLACKTCNQHWKRNLFPLRQRGPACVEGDERSERALLLDPSTPGFCTRDHFSWDIHGTITGLSDEGQATIITCGLNRKALRSRRAKAALNTLEAVRELNGSSSTKDRVREERARARLVELTSVSAEFTSLTRWFVEQSFGMAWERLDFGRPAGV